MSIPAMPTQTELNAWYRQGGTSDCDALCAICDSLLRAGSYRIDTVGGWYPIWRVPLQSSGKRRLENCVCLCPKCYTKFGQNTPQVIPRESLKHCIVRRPQK